jgi:hypothetical protein
MEYKEKNLHQIVSQLQAIALEIEESINEKENIIEGNTKIIQVNKNIMEEKQKSI